MNLGHGYISVCEGTRQHPLTRSGMALMAACIQVR